MAKSESTNSNKDLVHALACMVSAHCTSEHGHVNSFGMFANTQAIRLLEREGLVSVEHGGDRVVIGAWVDWRS